MQIVVAFQQPRLKLQKFEHSDEQWSTARTPKVQLAFLVLQAMQAPFSFNPIQSQVESTLGLQRIPASK